MREIAAAIIDNTVLTINRTEEGLYTYKAEYPGGGAATSAYADVRHAFYAMGREVYVLLHNETMKNTPPQDMHAGESFEDALRNSPEATPEMIEDWLGEARAQDPNYEVRDVTPAPANTPNPHPNIEWA